MINSIVINKKENAIVYCFTILALLYFNFGLVLFTGSTFNNIWTAFQGWIPLYLITIFIAIYYYQYRRYVFKISNKKICQLFLFFVCYAIYYRARFFEIETIAAFIYTFYFPIIFFIFFSLRDDLKVRIVDIFIKILTIQLSLSIIEYLIYVITGVSLIVNADLSYGIIPIQQSLFNFIRGTDFLIPGLERMFRFQSLTEEPGGLGTTCAMLLFLTSRSREYRKSYIVFWIAGILSFSLAFYIMAFIHLLLSINQKQIYSLFFLGLIVGLFVYLFQDVFVQLIIERIQGNEVDNRSSQELNNYLIRAFDSGKIWWGEGSFIPSSLGSNAGVKLMIYQDGLIGVIALVFAYIILFLNDTLRLRTNKIEILVFFIVFWLSFYQRHYITFFHYVLIYFTAPIFIVFKNRVFNLNKK